MRNLRLGGGATSQITASPSSQPAPDLWCPHAVLHTLLGSLLLLSIDPLVLRHLSGTIRNSNTVFLPGQGATPIICSPRQNSMALSSGLPQSPLMGYCTVLTWVHRPKHPGFLNLHFPHTSGPTSTFGSRSGPPPLVARGTLREVVRLVVTPGSETFNDLKE